MRMTDVSGLCAFKAELVYFTNTLSTFEYMLPAEVLNNWSMMETFIQNCSFFQFVHIAAVLKMSLLHRCFCWNLTGIARQICAVPTFPASVFGAFVVLNTELLGSIDFPARKQVCLIVFVYYSSTWFFSLGFHGSDWTYDSSDFCIVSFVCSC